jgi:hypothetical protein
MQDLYTITGTESTGRLPFFSELNLVIVNAIATKTFLIELMIYGSDSTSTDLCKVNEVY